jgi:hypothetical protein
MPNHPLNSNRLIQFGVVSDTMQAIGALLLACTLVLPAFAASDPFSGTWKLNVAKSKLLAPAPGSDTVRVEIEGNDLRIDREGVDEKGEPFKLTLQGGFDDSRYGISGFRYADAISFRRPAGRRILAEASKSGVVVAWLEAEVSGNTLKVNLSVLDAERKEIKSPAILQRDAP